jgi:hypothetical protein
MTVSPMFSHENSEVSCRIIRRSTASAPIRIAAGHRPRTRTLVLARLGPGR